MRRCQVCQLVKNTTGSCNCGRILCEACAKLGCCGKKPAAFAVLHMTGPRLVEESDEDGDPVAEPTPTVPVDPFSFKDELDDLWQDLGGSG